MIKGFINFKEEEYFFYLENDELTLTSLNQVDQYIDNLFGIINGREEVPDVLKGRISLSGGTILLFIKRWIKRSIGEYVFQVDSYIEYEDEIKSIERVSLSSKELDCFHNIGKSYNFQMSHPSGEVTLRLNPFEDNVKKFSFSINEKQIDAILSVSRNVSKDSNNPITINSTISFTFEKVDNYKLYLELVNLTKQFLQLISYRRNVYINQAILKEKSEMGYFKKVGTLVFPEKHNVTIENDKTIRQRIIDFDILNNCVSEVFQLLSKDQIYKDHIPQNSTDKNYITPARFILITAAFEWEFRSSYGNVKAKENSSFNEIQSDVLKYIEALISNNTGKKKNYARSFQKIISNSGMSLSEKILRVLNDSEGVLGDFIKNLYAINEIGNVTYRDMAERLQTQRNNFAHGNIDKELDHLVILDLIVLEWVIYFLVLRKAKMSDASIRHAINNLFARNFALDSFELQQQEQEQS